MEQGSASCHISIALPELPVAATLGPICPPDRLHLVAFEGESQLALIHGNVACKGNGEIIAQCPFCNALVGLALKDCIEILDHGFSFVWVVQSVIEDLENQFIAFFSIFPHQGFSVFHGRCFQRFKTIGFKNTTDGLKDEIPFSQPRC